MKLVLVNPPYCPPTSPPLGVCWLKAVVERDVPEWSVKVLDLNLGIHQDLFRWIDERACLYGPNFPEGPLGDIALSRAAEVFRGQHGDEFYNRPDRYTLYADLWLRFIPPEITNFQLLEEAHASRGPMPPHVTRHAEQVLAEQPAAVGISVGYAQQIWYALCLAKTLKQRADLPIIMGGTFFNGRAETAWTMDRGGVDCIISGEGEQPMVQLLAGRMNPEGVPGVSYRKDSQVVCHPPACEANLDRLGLPDFSDLDLRAYYSPQPVLPVQASRGCYWRRCAFCVHYKSAGQTYRQRSIARVVEELRTRVDAGIVHFSLIDEMISPARFSDLADAILDAGLKLYYYAMAKPVNQFDLPLLSKLHRSGCRSLMWGVESGSQRVLDLMDKGTKLPEIEAVLDGSRQAGIRSHVFVMAGFPTETRDEFRATMDLVARHRAAIAAVHRGIFHLEEGSPVFDAPEKFSIARTWSAGGPPLKNWYEFECNHGMSKQEAVQAFTEALPLMRSFNPFSTHLGSFRDHALLIYARQDP